MIFALSLTVHAQINTVNNGAMTPIPGAGHDYIKMLGETVNPASGTVSLRITIPTPKGRGLTLPFNIGYDSNLFLQVGPGAAPFYGRASWRTNLGYLSEGGWSYLVPMLNLDQWTQPHYETFGVGADGTSIKPEIKEYDCYFAGNYIFRDIDGVVRTLNMKTVYITQLPTENSPGAGQFCIYGSNSGYNRFEQRFLAWPNQNNLYDPNGVSDASAPLPITVRDSDGTVYQFDDNAALSPYPSGGTSYDLPSYIEDRNGNRITLQRTGIPRGVFQPTDTFSVTDTAGRPIINSDGFGPNGTDTANTITVAGQNYTVTWTTASASYSVQSVRVNEPKYNDGTPVGVSCDPVPSVTVKPGVLPVISRIGLPNGKSYQFYYGTDNPDPAYSNPFGLISEVIYPTGAWVKYKWRLNQTATDLAVYTGSFVNQPYEDGCLYQYDTPVLSSREVGFGSDSAPEQTQNFTDYSTIWVSRGDAWSQKTTTVTTYDNVTNTNTYTTRYTYSPMYLAAPAFSTTGYPGQTPIEQRIDTFQGTSSTNPVRTVNKTWNGPYQVTSETSQQDGLCSQTAYTYGARDQVTETDEYDYWLPNPTSGCGNPPTAPSRKTTTNYQSFSSGVGTIADEPCQKIVYDGSGNRAAETDYLYDGGTAVCGSAGGSPFASDVSASLPTGTYDTQLASGTPRGNLTKEIKKCFNSPNCHDAITSYTYDSTGQMVSSTSPGGNAPGGDPSAYTTNYFYTDNYVGGSASDSTNAYLTTIQYPPANGIRLSKSFSYYFDSGQLASSTDENQQRTSYEYNDPFSRLTKVVYPPGGGEVARSYDDYALTVTKRTKVTPSLDIVSTTKLDGVGHTIGTVLSSDPDGTVFTDIQYDGEGRVWKKSNPYRVGSSSTNGTTTFTYDALGRNILVLQPDAGATGSKVITAYSADTADKRSCVLVTDEATKQRKSCSDALGNLRRVWEPDANGNLNLQTNYLYDVLGNLECVEQQGGVTGSGCSSAVGTGGSWSSGSVSWNPGGNPWRMRQFFYDSLSRLVEARNPESGIIDYQYDPDGNLVKKIDARSQPISYCYDALNRLIGKQYSSTMDCTNPASWNVTYIYDVGTGFPLGQRTAMRDATGTTAWQHDQMGRILSEQRTIVVNGNPVSKNISYSFNLDGSTATITYPSGRVIQYEPSGSGKPRSLKDVTGTQ
jgi:YD repeat-containing protein